MGLDIYLIGICGTGMGALAGLLKQLGHRVRGSDEHVYPPMSDKLREWGISVLEGYDAAHLEERPDMVIVGNVIRRVNPEATRAREFELPTLSMPQALARFGIGERHCITVTGTHGKTTTTALVAHLLIHAGRDPGFLVGGALNNYPESFRAGQGDFFVVEGDEYDTAYFDKGPKFVHYRPRTAIMTSLEFDHADIYDSVEAIEASFAKLIAAVPEDGHLVIWEGATRALALAKEHGGPRRVTVYGEHGRDLGVARYSSGPEGLLFEPVADGESLGQMRVALWGNYSVQNTLAAIAAARDAGLDAEEIRAGLASFLGVRRRMEVRGQPGGVTVVDDFAHHPTAVRETLAAARTRWPDARLWAVFEPRSATTRRKTFQHDFTESFAAADCVVVGSHERLAEIPEAERFAPDIVARDLCDRGVQAWAIADVDAIVEHLRSETQPGDVLMILSNGAFGGLHDKLLTALGERR